MGNLNNADNLARTRHPLGMLFFYRLQGLTSRLTHLIARALVSFVYNRKAFPPSTPGKIVLEAGEPAWEHIFFKELLASAQEAPYFSEVVKFPVKKSLPYLAQVLRVLLRESPKYYLYDPRTGSQKTFIGVFSALSLGIILKMLNVTPIAYCTDISKFSWRWNVALVTANSGWVVCLSDKDTVLKMFPHRRVVGPAIMPLSQKTIYRLRDKRANKNLTGRDLSVVFVGAMYEPRATQLESISKDLATRGIDLAFLTRNLKDGRVPNNTYWQRLIDADIIVSTSSQVRGIGQFSEVNHLIYRFSEALAAGSCLVIEYAPGAERFFEDGTDLFFWRNEGEAAEIVANLVERPQKVERVALKGQKRMASLVEENRFWADIFEPSEPLELLL